MSIFLDLSGVSGTAFFNLVTVSGDDGGLGMADVAGDSTVMQITYTETAGQPATADRLNQLVNNNFGAPITTTQDIVVTAVNGGNDPYLGVDVTGNGFTYIDGDVIRVVYDVSRCCGDGVFNLDVGGNKISKPNPVVLYHELSHAFRAATGTQAVNDEVPAETDENVLRTQLGLCLRDVNSHDGGCGAGDTCGGSDGGPDGGPPAGGCAAGNDDGCFIVSATTGSSESAEVTSLRQLRDRVAGVSGLGAQLIDRIYGEYYQFSPQMAARLEQSLLARLAVLGIVVRPLLAWYALAGRLALDPADGEAVRQAARDVLGACPRHLGGASIVATLAALRSGAALPAPASRLLREFGPRLRVAMTLRYASWAIFDPLESAWDCVIHRHDPVDAVSRWLAQAPVQTLPAPHEPAQLDAELAALASFLDFRPQAKGPLGARLATAWPQATDALARHGFIAKRGA